MQSHCYFVIFAKNYYTDTAMEVIIGYIIGIAFLVFVLFVCWAMFVEVKKHGDDPICKTEVTITLFPEKDKDTDPASRKAAKHLHRPDDGQPPQIS